MKPSLLTLAFDCACSGLSVAVLEGETVLAQHFERTSIGQSATLAPRIQNTLAAAKVRIADIGLIAVTNGPGSFTGIRIGLAMARGLALALDTPLAACSTFQAVLANLPQPAQDTAPLMAIDSRRDEIFLALGTSERPFIVRPEQALSALPAQPYALIGDGAPLMRDAFAAAGRMQEIVEQDERPPVAANFAPSLAALGAEHWRRRNASDGLPRPLYLREADVTLPKAAGGR